MCPPSDQTRVAAAGRFLRLVFILVLLLAAFAGMIVTASPEMGLAALSFALVAGPVAVVVEDRISAARRTRPIPVPGVTSAAPV